LNGQKDEAIQHVEQGRSAWNFYCNEIPGKPGAPTPMMDGRIEKRLLGFIAPQ